MGIAHAVLYTASLGVVSHYVGQALPRRWFHPKKFPFRSFSWEQDGNLYRHLGVQHWKDLVPDMSKVMPDMLPKRINLHGTAAEAMALVQETCVAEAVHAVLMVLSVGNYLLCPDGWGAALAIFDAVALNLPYWIIQRYNRPKLLRLAEKLEKKEDSGHESSDLNL